MNTFVQAGNQLILVQGDTPIKSMQFSGNLAAPISCTLLIRQAGVKALTIEGLDTISPFLRELKAISQFVKTDHQNATQLSQFLAAKIGW